jgi:hypothetical protein
MKRYKAYVINLDSAPERWEKMQEEFQGTILDLIRVPAVANKEGWIGNGESFVKIIQEHMKKDPDFTNELLIVLEDDLKRVDSIPIFNKRCSKIFEALKKKSGTYSHFQGGGIYPSGLSIESRHPFLLRCDYITCASFTIFQKDAANSVLEWDRIRNDMLDNFMANQNRGKMLAPYPHLVYQRMDLSSQIGNESYKQTINNAFRDARKTLSAFVRRSKTRRRKF